MDRTSERRPLAWITLLGIVLAALFATESTADAATTEAPAYGVAAAVPAFWTGHVLGDLLLDPTERWNVPPHITAIAFLGVGIASAALDPLPAIPLAALSGALLWPDRGNPCS